MGFIFCVFLCTYTVQNCSYPFPQQEGFWSTFLSIDSQRGKTSFIYDKSIPVCIQFYVYLFFKSKMHLVLWKKWNTNSFTKIYKIKTNPILMCNDIFKKLKALYEIHVRRFTVLMLFSFIGLQIHFLITYSRIICSFVDSFLINYPPTLHIIRVRRLSAMYNWPVFFRWVKNPHFNLVNFISMTYKTLHYYKHFYHLCEIFP